MSSNSRIIQVKVVTEDGIYGLGGATLNGRELAVASSLSDHVVPLLIGRDARRIEDTWQYLYNGAYWRRGPVTMAAIAAVVTALWDNLSKIAQPTALSVARGRITRCGSRIRSRQRSRNRRTVAAVAQYHRAGYRLYGLNLGSGGLKAPMAPARDMGITESTS